MSVKATLLSAWTFLLIGVSIITAKEFTVNSPNKKIELKVNVTNVITYSLSHNGYSFILPSQVSMTLADGTVLGKDPKFKDEKKRTVNELLKPVVRQKYETITDNFNELTLEFGGNYSLIFRVYNDGIAFRYRTTIKNDITVKSEQLEFNFDKNYKIWFPEESKLMTHYEPSYQFIPLSDVNSKRFCLIPALIDLDNNLKCAITEADLEDYCGFYLTGTSKPNQLAGMFPAYPAKDTAKNDRDIYVTARKDYLAVTRGTRNFPWRVIVVSEKDGDLVESTMIYKLAKPADPKIDFSWVKPGKVAWDWWNFNNIIHVDFKAGLNTETYKYYIDFASKYGIEYIILDEGWYKKGDLLTDNPDMNIKEIIDYGKKKNVRIILWAIWKTLDDQFQQAFDKFEMLGAKGIKVDFMQRDDQPVVNYYYKVASEAAKRKLLVDFHGAYKPTGLYRTYPNVITNEGVKGLEHNKWSQDETPEHCVTLPFTRMLAGPMDYTPGAMVNGTKSAFRDIFSQPMSQGTRCNQLAMYVIYESPLQMLADNPTNYYREPECLEFLSKVPTVWDDTKVLDAKVSEYLLTARRNGKTWYIGAMTNWTPRDMTVDLSFLPDGEYKIDIWQDGINADRNASDFKKVTETINKNTKLNIHLAPGGGWAAIVTTK